MLIDLSGKNALVCGSSKGIGLAIAKELASSGARVTLMARNVDALQKAVAELDDSKGQMHDFIVADFGVPGEVKERIGERSSGDTIYHILVNNSGGPAPGPVYEATEEDFQKAFQAHLLSSHHLMQALVEGMKRAGYGRIINVISTSVKIPLKGLGVSNTIRAAVGNWSKTLANELAPFGITVNNILPGATATDRLSEIISNKSRKTGTHENELREEMLSEIPMKRFAEPTEL